MPCTFFGRPLRHHQLRFSGAQVTGGSESQAVFLKGPILYHITPPHIPCPLIFAFFFSIALMATLIYGHTPWSSVCFFVPRLAHGWSSITICSMNDWKAQGLGRQCQSAHTLRHGGKPGVLISQLSRSPAASGLPKRISKLPRLSRAMKCLQVLPQHSSGHCEKCQAFGQLIIPVASEPSTP